MSDSCYDPHKSLIKVLTGFLVISVIILSTIGLLILNQINRLSVSVESRYELLSKKVEDLEKSLITKSDVIDIIITASPWVKDKQDWIMWRESVNQKLQEKDKGN